MKTYDGFKKLCTLTSPSPLLLLYVNDKNILITTFWKPVICQVLRLLLSLLKSRKVPWGDRHLAVQQWGSLGLNVLHNVLTSQRGVWLNLAQAAALDQS